MLAGCATPAAEPEDSAAPSTGGPIPVPTNLGRDAVFEAIKNSQHVGDGLGGAPEFASESWNETMRWLRARDAGAAEQPIVAAWSDYSRWINETGGHPAAGTVLAGGRELLAHLLLSQSETHAIQIMAWGLLATLPPADARAALAEVGLADPDAAAATLASYTQVEPLDLEGSARLLAIAEARTGERFRYVIADTRSIPLDNPSTPHVDAAGIMWAIAAFAGHYAEDFNILQVRVRGEDQWHTPAFEPGWGEGVEMEKERMLLTRQFRDSLLWRAFWGPDVGVFTVGGPPNTTADPAIPEGAVTLDRAMAGFRQPGAGFVHFRAVRLWQDGVVLEYTPGAIVRGHVMDRGAPVAGVEVSIHEDSAEQSGGMRPLYGAQHARATTDAEGFYELRSIFSLGGTLRVVARAGADSFFPLAEAEVSISREAAELGDVFTLDLVRE